MAARSSYSEPATAQAGLTVGADNNVRGLFKSVTRTLTNIRGGALGILHAMRKDQSHSSPMFAVLVILIDFIQTLAYPLDSRFYSENSVLYEILHQFAARLDVEIYLADIDTASYLALLRVCYIAVYIVMLDAFWVGYCYKTDFWPVLWPVRVLRVAIAGFVTVLFFPIFATLSKSVGTLQPDTPILDSILASVAGAAFFPFAILAALTLFCRDSVIFGSRVHGRLDAVIVILKTVIVFSFEIIHPDHVGGARTVNAISCLVASTICCASYAWLQPFFSRALNSLSATLYGALIGASCAALLTCNSSTHSGEIDGLLVFTFMLLSASVAFMFARFYAGVAYMTPRMGSQSGGSHLLSWNERMRLRVPSCLRSGREASRMLVPDVDIDHLVELDKQLSHMSQRRRRLHKMQFPTAYHVEVMTRSIVTLDAEDRDPTAEELSTILELYAAGLEQFPQNDWLVLQQLTFIKEFDTDNIHKELFLQGLSRLQKIASTFDVHFFLFSAMEEGKRSDIARSVGDNEIDLVGSLEIQKNLGLAQERHVLALRLMKQFWRDLLTTTGELVVSDLQKTMARIVTARQGAQFAFLSLLEKYPNSSAILRAYGRFLEEVQNDPWNARAMYDHAEALENERRVTTVGDRQDANDTPAVQSPHDWRDASPGATPRVLQTLNRNASPSPGPSPNLSPSSRSRMQRWAESDRAPWGDDNGDKERTVSDQTEATVAVDPAELGDSPTRGSKALLSVKSTEVFDTEDPFANFMEEAGQLPEPKPSRPALSLPGGIDTTPRSPSPRTPGTPPVPERATPRLTEADISEFEKGDITPVPAHQLELGKEIVSRARQDQEEKQKKKRVTRFETQCEDSESQPAGDAEDRQSVHSGHSGSTGASRQSVRGQFRAVVQRLYSSDRASLSAGVTQLKEATTVFFYVAVAVVVIGVAESLFVGDLGSRSSSVLATGRLAGHSATASVITTNGSRVTRSNLQATLERIEIDNQAEVANWGDDMTVPTTFITATDERRLDLYDAALYYLREGYSTARATAEGEQPHSEFLRVNGPILADSFLTAAKKLADKAIAEADDVDVGIIAGFTAQISLLFCLALLTLRPAVDFICEEKLGVLRVFVGLPPNVTAKIFARVSRNLYYHEQEDADSDRDLSDTEVEGQTKKAQQMAQDVEAQRKRRKRRVAWDGTGVMNRIHVRYAFALVALSALALGQFLVAQNQVGDYGSDVRTLLTFTTQLVELRATHRSIAEITYQGGHPTANQTATLQGLINKVTNLTNALAFGSEESGILGFRWKATAEGKHIFFGDICTVDSSSIDTEICVDDWDYEFGRSGLHAGVISYLDRVKQILEGNTDGVFVHRTLQIEDGILYLTGKLALITIEDASQSHIQEGVALILGLMAVNLVAWICVYLLVLVPMATELGEEIRSAHMMILMIPFVFLNQLPQAMFLLKVDHDSVGDDRDKEEEHIHVHQVAPLPQDTDADYDPKADTPRLADAPSLRLRVMGLLDRYPLLVVLCLGLCVWVWWVPMYLSSEDIRDYVDEYSVLTAAMCFGGFVAGSTPLGGGVIAYPVMATVLKIKPGIARDFSLIIQSVGMSFASIFLVIRRAKIEYTVYKYAMVGSVLGSFTGYFCDGIIPPKIAKITFSSLWMGLAMGIFLVTTRVDTKTTFSITVNGKPLSGTRVCILTLFGFVGGIVSHLSGAGIDTLLFSILSALYRLDETITIPTSVLIMASTAVFNSLLRYALVGIAEQAVQAWWACTVVVCVTAPFGSLILMRLSSLSLRRMYYASATTQFVMLVAIVLVHSLRMTFFSFLVTCTSCLTVYFGGINGFIERQTAQFVAKVRQGHDDEKEDFAVRVVDQP